MSSVNLCSTSGVGLSNSDPTVTPDGLDPKVELQISKDGARTFNSHGTRAIGKLGEFDKQQVWRRIGRAAYSLILRFDTSAPVLVDFQRLDIEIKGKM